MSSIKKMLLGLFAAAGLVSAAQADPSEEAMLQKLKRTFPATQFSDVRKAPVAGLWEVIMGQTVAYTDAEGRYFVFGHVFDMKERRDLTAEVKRDRSKVNFGALPLEQAIKITRGTGRRKFAVFSDPNCHFCKQLEKTLAGITDYTVYIFPMPILEGSFQLAESIWCAKDRVAIWSAALKDGARPAAATCANPLQANLQLAKTLGISATPTLISAGGRLHPGGMEKDRLQVWLDTEGEKQ